MVLKELIFNSLYFGNGVVVLKEPIFNSLYFGRVWWSRLINFNSLYFGSVWWS